MSSHGERVGDLDLSAIDLGANWDSPPRVWHRSYPQGIPTGLVYPSYRVECLLKRTATTYPDRKALAYFRTQWNYSELLERVNQVAANLAAQGVKAGDRVLVALPNCPEFVAAWFALLWLGAEIVPANPLLASKDLVWLAQTSRARVAIGLDLRLDPIRDLARQLPMDLVVVVSLARHLPLRLGLPYRLKTWWAAPRFDTGARVIPFESLYAQRTPPMRQAMLADSDLPAVLQPTGGTTGTPKIAVLTHRNLVCNTSQLLVWSDLKAGNEVVLAVTPFFHVFGATVGMLSAIAGGATLVPQARFHLPAVWDCIERWQPSVAPMVPFMVASLCREMRRRNRKLEGLRFCLTGAAPLGRRLAEEFTSWTGATVVEGYGLSEASPVTHANPPAAPRHGTIGLPLPDTEARIVDVQTGQIELEPGEVGELVVRGPQVMAGYLDNPEETSQTLRDGWLHTGDLARVNEDGFFTIVDRKKDLIISGGLNIYPSEVERVLCGHGSVRECAVVGLPDPLYGEKVVGYVVTVDKGHIDPAQLQAHCRAKLASYKIPRAFEFCEELPTNFLGKVKRIELRQPPAESPSQVPPAAAN